MTRSQRELRTVKMSEARENASDQVVIGFSTEFDWLRRWHVFSGPITAQSRLKQNQSNPKSQIPNPQILTEGYDTTPRIFSKAKVLLSQRQITAKL